MTHLPTFSPHYRKGWVDGCRYALERIADHDPPEEIERAAQAIADEGEKRSKRFTRKNRTGERED